MTSQRYFDLEIHSGKTSFTHSVQSHDQLKTEAVKEDVFSKNTKTESIISFFIFYFYFLSNHSNIN